MAEKVSYYATGKRKNAIAKVRLVPGEGKITVNLKDYKDYFHREVLEELRNKSSIEAALSQILDSPVKLQFIITDRKSKEPDLDPPPLGREELKKKEPIIDATLNIFGGKIFRTRNTE